MNPIIRNVIAIMVGIVIGSAVNMGILMLGHSIIPTPEGVDTTTMESLKASMHLFEPRHFIFPFIAHSVGTLIGAMIAAMIALKNKKWFAIGISVFFLAGGITNVFILPSPFWFTILDLVFAYIPMGLVAGQLVGGRRLK